MFSIGQFAALTGLSVKALRHYDDVGLLHPEQVEQSSGYRYYSSAQVRPAATIAVLRGMEMPVPMVRQALENPGQVNALTERFAAERAARRLAEDQTFASCRKILTDYDEPLAVESREAEPLNWVGFKAVVGEGDEEVGEFNTSFDAFFAAVYEAGLDPLGYWWMIFDAEQNVEEGRFATSWMIPVRQLPALGTDLGREYVEGTLPRRTEYLVRLGQDPAIDDAVSAPHAGLLILLEAGLEIVAVSQIRQVYLPQQGGDMRMALVADVPAR